MEVVNWNDVTSPILTGHDDLSYRDPTALYHDGRVYLYYSYVRREEKNRFYWYVAMSESTDLRRWSAPVIVTPRGLDLNYSSPGNVVYHDGRWLMSVQTLPTPAVFVNDPENTPWDPSDPVHVTGDHRCRILTLESRDLRHWRDPVLLRVKGPDVRVEDMGRIIDPFLCRDATDPKRWWCFYKQNGMAFSCSRDLEHWTYAGSVEMGENVCVLVIDGTYWIYHSPENGIGLKTTRDLRTFRDHGVLTLGQSEWPWAEKRLTAGFVCDLRSVDSIGKYVMFFHGSSRRWNKAVNKHGHSSIGVAWSDDLSNWSWPSS